MARRNNDHRTWDELSRPEQRTGLALLAAVGLVAVIGVWFLIGGDGADAETGAAAPPTIDLEAELADWYQSTSAVRTDVARAATDVRTHIGANDGISLRPACEVLDRAARDAAEIPAAPLESAARTWSDGAAAYAGAARACGNLFDGTPVPPPTLLTRTTSALDTADGLWARLASDLGEPALVVPPA
ncbi:hypothetical protein MXD62_02245 [Frankia sp. Mgl5]|uniref:hypothetical protein n=1 Tax=Frankiaceae TaxID=74712 RepID=UPI000DA45A2B|nr:MULTISPECIES: hypothetical protein [Frankiaceae]MCK9925993.1 hypothetical protein [Frankia sp. Mgl5]TCJ36897.1 hypothetical protein E0504_21730 [Parafrankia sp. BMG5.11]SQD94022.1 conserved hypothetical protein [Parafrankia sp. Ea1.12]